MREVVEKGEIVVREGNVVGALDLEKLEALGLQQPAPTGPTSSAPSCSASSLSSFSLATSRTSSRTCSRATAAPCSSLSGILLLTLAARLAGSEHVLETVTWVYFVPFAVLPMLVAMLIDQQLAVVIGHHVGILAGYTAGRAFDVGALVMLGRRRWRAARAPYRTAERLLLGGRDCRTHQCSLSCSRSILPSSDSTMSRDRCRCQLMAAGQRRAGCGHHRHHLCSPGQPAACRRTVLHLLELAHPSQPLFRRLLLEAPGTYHHSVVISTLAERAAEAIGADSLLARVGAYYHDIGKVVRPYLYIENQVNGD